MAPQPLTFSPNYLAVARGIRELHRLGLECQDDSPEADAIRDATDGPWEALSETERRRVSGLSEDLYSISEPVSEVPETNPQAQAKLVEAFEASHRGEWDRALELVRRWGKHLSPAPISYLRGLIWLEAGDAEAAALFCEHAAQLEPQNGKYLAYYLKALDIIDPTEARRKSEEILQDSEDHPPLAVATASAIMLMAIRRVTEAEAVSWSKRLVSVLEKNISRISAGDDGGLDQSAYALASGLLGISYERVGENRKALESYSCGLQVDPNNVAMLVYRGILLYGSSPQAITDFERAVAIGTSVILPYYGLAHHYLINGRFKDSLGMCERASRMPAELDSMMGELAEWTAICQAELGFPSGFVEASFETSIRLNPSNDRARRNLAAFEEAMRPPLTRRWETPTAAVVRASGMSARQFVPAA
jgi:tetratricopeptide (TPR) repeat protein